MNNVTQGRILPVTRWLVYFMMAMVTAVAAGVLLASVLLPIYWNDVAVVLAERQPPVELTALLPPLVAIFVIGLVVIGLTWTILRKLLVIIASVEMGDPFVHANAMRLKTIGWTMVALHIIGLPLAGAARMAADLFGKNEVGVDLSFTGILATLLIFILAGIFERGAEMREELKGTV